MMPSCDQTGGPLHFHSSTTFGSASLMSFRILPSVFPRQSPRSAILSEMSSDAGRPWLLWRPWLVPDFFMFLLSLDDAGAAALDRVSLQRRYVGLGIVRIGNHPHAHLHFAGFEIDDDVAAPPAFENAHADYPAASARGDHRAARRTRSRCRRTRWRR